MDGDAARAGGAAMHDLAVIKDMQNEAAKSHRSRLEDDGRTSLADVAMFLAQRSRNKSFMRELGERIGWVQWVGRWASGGASNTAGSPLQYCTLMP